MTAGELLERGRGVARWRWTPTVAVALLALVLVCRLDQGRRASEEAVRLAEAEVLRQAGLAVAAQEDASGMRRALARVAGENEDLAGELARVKAASPGAKPVAVIHATTGGVVAGGTPREQGAPPTQGQANRQAGAADRDGAPCLLASGDVGEIRVDSAILETKGGNVVFAGAASCWRLEPGPASRLFGGPLRAELAVEKLPGKPGYGFGLSGSVGSEGARAGLAVALPPARLWSWQIETTLRLEVSPSALAAAKPEDEAVDWSAGATVLGRRWR